MCGTDNYKVAMQLASWGSITPIPTDCCSLPRPGYDKSVRAGLLPVEYLPALNKYKKIWGHWNAGNGKQSYLIVYRLSYWKTKLINKNTDNRIMVGGKIWNQY